MAQKSKALPLAAIAIVVLLLIAYFGGNWYLSEKVFPQKIHEQLAKNDLEDTVHWKDQKATILGHKEITGLEIGQQDAERLVADKVLIHDVDDGEHSSDFDVELLNVHTSEGRNPLLASMFQKDLASYGYTDLKPIENLRIKSHQKDNRFSLDLALKQEDLANIDFSYDLNISEKAMQALGHDAKRLRSPESLVFLGLFLAPEIDLSDLKLSIEDTGFIKHLHDTRPLEAQDIEQGQATCEQQLAGSFADAKDKCQAIYAFAKGDKKQLHIALKPEEPTNVAKIVETIDSRSSLSAPNPEGREADTKKLNFSVKN
ncbi:hypothetical protein [Brackiella oedipodis]|uniref:hypothetical protein n=1 Tax=Brackiella oedipodis TaxID=124225 RepID=UPI000490AA85|nr:hypothetical protein [Brackiella oedipodis]